MKFIQEPFEASIQAHTLYFGKAHHTFHIKEGPERYKDKVISHFEQQEENIFVSGIYTRPSGESPLCWAKVIPQPRDNNLTLDEWVERRHYKFLRAQWEDHLLAFGVSDEDADELSRLCMMSLRQELSK